MKSESEPKPRGQNRQILVRFRIPFYLWKKSRLSSLEHPLAEDTASNISDLIRHIFDERGPGVVVEVSGTHYNSLLLQCHSTILDQMKKVEFH